MQKNVSFHNYLCRQIIGWVRLIITNCFTGTLHLQMEKDMFAAGNLLARICENNTCLLHYIRIKHTV